MNTIVMYCRQDDAGQQEPTDTTTFTQHGAIDFKVFVQDEHRNIFEVAEVAGNNLVRRTFSVSTAYYEAAWIEVAHAASKGASIVEIQGFKL